MSDNQHPSTPETPKENVISEYVDGVKKMEMQGYESGIKKARTALFVTAFLVLLGEVLTISMAGLEWTPLMIGIVAIEVGIFVALAFWTKTKPYTAIVVGLIVFVLYWVAAIALNGLENAYKGVIVKVIIIVTLVQAIKPAKAWEDTKKTL
mgnify:FL=1